MRRRRSGIAIDRARSRICSAALCTALRPGHGAEMPSCRGCRTRHGSRRSVQATCAGLTARGAPQTRDRGRLLRLVLSPRQERGASLRVATATCRARTERAKRSAGRLAQLVERLLYTQDVGGSSPSPPTNLLRAPRFAPALLAKQDGLRSLGEGGRVSVLRLSAAKRFFCRPALRRRCVRSEKALGGAQFGKVSTHFKIRSLDTGDLPGVF
jgi:hypothetical protein